MAAGIAHEINNPLAGILLYSSNLVKKARGDRNLKEGLEVIIQESKRCKTIIQELLDFSRDRAPQRALASINDIIEKALSILDNEFRLRHIRIERTLSDTIEKTLLDENQIEQVFVNLLINAIQAIGEGGTIAINSRMLPENPAIEVVFADNGCGIPKEQIHKIFEPFFSTKKHGTGLGLAVSYGILRNHNGDITVSSVPGEGTRFTIQLPIGDQ
jgi:signal transduction histidine kinase